MIYLLIKNKNSWQEIHYHQKSREKNREGKQVRKICKRHKNKRKTLEKYRKSNICKTYKKLQEVKKMTLMNNTVKYMYYIMINGILERN